MATTILGSVTKVYDSLWLTRSASGEKVANSTNLRAAQLVIENATPAAPFLRWNREVSVGGVERWVATEDTTRLGGARMMARAAAAPSDGDPSVASKPKTLIPSTGSGAFPGFGAGFVSPFKK